MKKPLISNAYVRGYLLETIEKIGAHNDDESQHVIDALRAVLDAVKGVRA